MSFVTIMYVVNGAEHLLCGDVLGIVKESAFAVVSTVGGDVVKEVLGDAD